MRLVEFWQAITGRDPRWLYIDSKVVDYPELSRLNARRNHFITFRRRGATILRRSEALPGATWTAVLDTARRCHQSNP